MATPRAAARHVKLLLDEMHTPRIARTLVANGWDVVAVAADTRLRGLPDENLLIHAEREGRAIVTENVPDFSILAKQWVSEGREHAGIVFTNPNRFNRASVAYPGDLTQALQAFLEQNAASRTSWTWWL